MRIREILQRIKRLERQLEPRVEVMTPAQIRAMQRFDDAQQIVERLHEGRRRASLERDPAPATLAGTAVPEESEITEK